eukprot:356736-Chlamydomonas_euryale.AAC.5
MDARPVAMLLWPQTRRTAMDVSMHASGHACTRAYMHACTGVMQVCHACMCAIHVHLARVPCKCAIHACARATHMAAAPAARLLAHHARLNARPSACMSVHGVPVCPPHP